MRIAIVSRSIGRNDGQGRVNREIAVEALRQGHEVSLFCEDADADLAGLGASLALAPPPANLPSRLLRDQVFAWRSRVAHRQSGAPVVLSNGFASWAPSDVNAVHFVHRAWLRSPHHPWRHESGPRALYARLYSGLNARFEHHAFRRASRVVAVSGKVREELEQAGVPAARIVTILNGVDTAEFRPAEMGEREAARLGFGLPRGVCLALFAGDLKTPRKNLDTVLRALARTEDVHLAVAGRHEGTPGPAMAQALGIGERVHFLGFQRDMPALMRAADMFVFPSRYEPCGLVLLEALASGIPVITSQAAGGAEIVTSDVGTVLADSEDDAGLAHAMATLAADEARRAAMAPASRDLALLHGWSRMARRYLDVLDEAARLRPVAQALPGRRLLSHA